MRKLKLFILILSLGLISSTSFSEDGEEEAVQPSNPQELLEIVKQGQFADTQQQRDREAQFRNEKNRQAKLLSDAKDERARLEREAARLEQKFEANEALLVVAEEQLRERLGSLNEIFGHLAGNTTDAIVPSLEGEYILKFQDDGGRFSVGETSVVMDLPNVIDTQVILQDREDLDTPPFNGTDTNTIFNTTTSALQLADPTVSATGEYEFANVIDLGGVFSLNLQRVIRSIGFNIGDNIEALIPNGSFWDDYATDGNFDGAAANNTNTQIQVATSQSASGAFGSFNTFANGVFKGQRFKFRLLLSTTHTAQNMNVQQAGYNAEFQSRTEQSYQTGSGTSIAPQSSGTSAKTITFGSPFFVGTSSLGGVNAYLPSVGITIQNAEAGDFFTITNVTGSGFTISVKNGSSFVDRSFTFQAVGYGKGV